MTCTIDIFDTNCVIKGTYPVAAIDEATSYYEEGAQFSPAYRKKLWDGRRRLFNKKTGVFPTGLLHIVQKVCEEHGVVPEITDHRQIPDIVEGGFDLHGISMEGKYSYQADAIRSALRKKRGIIKIATNGGKTSVMAGITKYLGVKTLVIVPTVELLHQLRKVFQIRLQADDEQIGIVGDSVWAPGSWVTVATPGTLSSRLKTDECIYFLSQIECLFIDECHRTGADELYKVVSVCPAYYRFGASGTPLLRSDGADLRLIAATGDLICDISNKMLVELGVSPPARIIFDKVTSPVLEKRIKYATAYKQGIVTNPELINKVVAWTKAFRQNDLRVLILIDELEQGRLIDDALWNNTDGEFIPHQFISGEETSKVRKEALEDFAAGNLPVLIASTILDEGVDVPTIDGLILAGSRKSSIRTLQRLGRGLRGERLVAIEFANYCHRYLVEHSLQRLSDYAAEECFPIVQFREGQDRAALIKKCWDEQAKG